MAVRGGHVRCVLVDGRGGRLRAMAWRSAETELGKRLMSGEGALHVVGRLKPDDYMGRQAVNQGYYPLRIATHEFGHLLGLPDRRTGLCSDLMSGSSAPVSCRNATPSSRERAEVNANFAGSLALAA